jgi:G3E family GTPase
VPLLEFLTGVDIPPIALPERRGTMVAYWTLSNKENTTMIAKLILVGGFLGSGKTTLLAEAAKRFAGQGQGKPGLAVGLITNDQAPELVDTRLLTGIGNGVSEVAGSCFCCNFDGFVHAVQSLAGQGATIVIAEPVGSCTDLSATIMNPLKKFHPDWNLAPLTVLVDPSRLPEIFDKAASSVDPDALYIMQLHLAEADRILVSKSDLLSDAERKDAQTLLEKEMPGKKIGFISSKTGEGFDSWFSEIQRAGDAGATIVPVDYDRYAHGEAVLGWLNATATVAPNTDGKKLLTDVLTAFHAALLIEHGKKINLEIGHVKAVVSVGGNEWIGNLTSLKGIVDVREAEPKPGNALLVLNARVQMSPETLEILVRDLFKTFNLSIDSLRCLMPGRPNPTHRLAKPEA